VKKLFLILAIACCCLTAAAQQEPGELYDAVKSGLKPQVEAVIAKGANVNSRNDSRQNPGEVMRRSMTVSVHTYDAAASIASLAEPQA